MQQNCSFIFSSFVRSFVYLSASFFVYLIICFFVHLFMPIYCVLINFFYSLSHLMNYSFTCFFIYWLTVFVHLSVCLFIYLRVRSINSLGFTAGVQINKWVGPACSTSDWKIRVRLPFLLKKTACFQKQKFFKNFTSQNRVAKFG